nr:IPT/TIG domain-containing protein [uncultured Actinoplanes sp.]
MSKPRIRLDRRKLGRAALTVGTVTAVVTGTATAALAVAPTAVAVTLTPAVGPSGGGNSITIAIPGNTPLDAQFSATSRVQFQFGTGGTDNCASTIGTPTPVTASAGIVQVPLSGTRVLTPYKLAVTVPTGTAAAGGLTLANSTPANFLVCVYDTSNSDALTAKSTSTSNDYQVGPVARIDSITPATGPSQGNTTIKVTGANLDLLVGANGSANSAGSVTIDGQVAAIVGVPTASTLYATVPAHSAGGPFTVALNAPGGQTVKQASYTYTNGISISPNTAPNTKVTPTDVDITGVGFQSMDWSGTANGNTPNSPTAHVYLVKGIYDPTATGNVGLYAAPKTNGQITECQDVLVIGDTELVCSLYLAGNGLKSLGGAANRSGLTGTTASTTATTLTVGSGTLSQQDVGAAVRGTGIADGVYITNVTNATTATLNKATGTQLAAAALTLLPSRTLANVVRTSGSPTVTLSGGFAATDVGRPVYGTGIPNGATIAAVANDTNSATLSTNANQTFTGDLRIGATPVAESPVPNGTYTLTVVSNGTSDVQTGGARADAAFKQSIISSGSTFTVADY